MKTILSEGILKEWAQRPSFALHSFDSIASVQSLLSLPILYRSAELPVCKQPATATPMLPDRITPKINEFFVLIFFLRVFSSAAARYSICFRKSVCHFVLGYYGENGVVFAESAADSPGDHQSRSFPSYTRRCRGAQ